MIAIKELRNSMSLNRSLSLVGVSKTKWYYNKRRRDTKTDPVISMQVQKIGRQRPTYGSRRMAAAISRELQTPINRKRIQKIFRKLGWIEPVKTKKEIMRSGKKLLRATAPNQLWQTDITYIWCGIDGWCYCFNVLDTFTRKWLSYIFDVRATKDAAIESIVQAVAQEKPDPSGLVIRSDNGTQYTSKEFRKSIEILGIKQEYIWHHTPEQNGHVESFHKTLKKGYIWPQEFTNFQMAEIALAGAFQDYNNQRIHSSVGYMPPNEFIKQWEMTHK